MSNEQKFKAMCANVADLRRRDRAATAEMEKATAEWKRINAELTEANKVLNAFVANWRNEETQ